ncbi:MAG: beta-galactosidase [Candidatus Zipacnadales bacterium]
MGSCLLVAGSVLLTVSQATAQNILFMDAFEDYRRGQCLDLQWQVQSGKWWVEAGHLVGQADQRGLAWASASPISTDQSISAIVTPVKRLVPGTWAACGVALWAGNEDFWRLTLVEAPDGRRYAELLEQLGGKWQAQAEGATALQVDSDGVEGFPWEFDHSYRMTLMLSPDRIIGEVADNATGQVLFRKGYVLPSGAAAVRRGRTAMMVDSMEAEFDDVRTTGSLPVPSIVRSSRAAVLDTGMPEANPELLKMIQAAFADADIECSVLKLSSSSSGFFLPGDLGLLVLPHTRRLPLGLVREVDAYLKRGGSVIFLGGPLGEETLVSQAEGWLPLKQALERTPTERLALRFSTNTLKSLQRHHGPDEGGARWEVEAGPPGQQGPALHVKMEKLHSWDTLAHLFAQSPFSEGQTLTCFWAKGGPRTSHLTLEWQEADGSRWMATVALTETWKRYVLSPRDFVYWKDSKSVGRGGPDDRFHPQNAVLLAVGLAKSHAPLPEGSHTYWIADVGVATAPFPVEEPLAPVLETVSPAYKTYVPTVTLHEIVAAPNQALVSPTVRLPAPTAVRCAMPRTKGLGLKAARIGRWIPLLKGVDRKGVERGSVASIYISMTEPYPQTAWGVIGIEDGAYLLAHRERLGPILGSMARYLLEGVHLTKAGADQFSYLPGQYPVFGGQVANYSASPQELRLRTIVRADKRATVLFERTWPLSAAPGVFTGKSVEWPQALEPGVYEVQTELWRGQTVIDVVAHEFVCLPKSSPKASDFVTVRDGDFWLNGKPWHPHGINYWPSNATAQEHFSYWLHWLHPANYDPEVISRDLQALADLKINSVSIALQNREQLPALLHFLYRCRQYDIRANVFVGGGHPIGFDVGHAVDLIKAGDLANEPTIYAWDIAWEPHFGEYESRCALDGRWAEWVAERYGSLENAEKDWGVAVPRKETGSITGPSQEQILNDGEHRILVAAYRRFLDDLVSEHYGRWARTVRAVDPRHLIGVRSGYGGTGQPGIDFRMPFDLISGAKHLDFISPEGYGLGGQWENFERGGFTTEYGRFAGGGKPVFWAEFGMSVYPEYTSERLEAQRQLYDNFYRMVIWSGARGSAGWWFPGGFRVGENSDYGVMNPDLTPRPSALAMRKWAGRMVQRRALPVPDYWITIDRDLHPRGYSELWRRHRDEYVKVRQEGRWVGLRTEGTGSDSTNTPLVAVGNTRANGTNPPKYLNAEFNFVRLRAGGDWIDVSPGESINVPPNTPVELVASLGNTGEALWVSPAQASSRPGGVYLVDAPGSQVTVEEPLTAEVPRFADVLVGPVTLAKTITQQTVVSLRLNAKGRTPFGAHFQFVLRPS